MHWLQKFLFGNAAVKALVASALNIATGVLGGTFVLEITKPDGSNGLAALAWRDAFGTFSFWGLIATLVITGLYNWRVARFERREQYQGELREQAYRVLVPAALDHYRRETEAGNLRPMSEVMKMLGLDEDGR